jgi:hypothetical protein
MPNTYKYLLTVYRTLAFPLLPTITTGNIYTLSALLPICLSIIRNGYTLQIDRPSNIEALLSYIVSYVNANRYTHYVDSYSI